jgi:tripartite-type tricarboxylate transporter receptor subunit TctC
MLPCFRYAHAIAGACALLACSIVFPQTYPTKPIRWVVPVSPGGPVDMLTRAIGQPISTSLGQPVLVENRASVSQITGAEVLAKSAPDGYTLLSHANFVPHKFLYRSLPYDYLRDFAPISLIARSAMIIFVHDSVPARTHAELLAYLKANPGKLAYGSSGVGQPFHLAMEMWKRRTGTDILHVPYKGVAQLIPDFIAGRVQLTFFNPVEQLISQVKAGKLRALAITGDRRMAELPDMPTFDEVGIRDFDPTGYVAASAPAGTPRDIIERLNREIVKAVALPEVRKVYGSLNMQPVTTSPEQFAQMIKNDVERWGPLIKSLGITLDQ